MPQNAKDVAVLVGSLRKDSTSRKTALALAALAPDSLRLDLVETGHLPFYDQDFDTAPASTPEAYRAFRERIARADSVLFVTPEYNRSYPAHLKNAIDIGTRPYGKNVWSGKPAGVVSVSMGAMGGFGANQSLRQQLANVNMSVLQQPEVYIGGADKIFDADGGVKVEATEAFLRAYLAGFASWSDRLALAA
ncbi:MAG TPA: NAD(P)H-dependent oxidoreductase [Stellaceae bacterium]|jgi:chromate reductase|nr:NAD(P)H-dependent oxidoreductase [Stellaceae bacterium]